jgi:DNA polymerase III sliding clamp (beta) subunit (PCNA family)
LKFRINGKVLREAAALVNHAVNSKSSVPDESHVLLGVSSGMLSLAGRNANFMVVTTKIPVADSEDGNMLVHAEVWTDIVSKSGDMEITIEADDDLTSVIASLSGSKGKPSVYNLTKVLPATQYAAIERAGTGVGCIVEKFHLRDAFRTVKQTADTDNTFTMVNGVCLEFNGDSLRVVATDMLVLGFAKIDATYPGGSAGKLIRVVPKEAIDLLDKMISGMAGSDLTITAWDRSVSFQAENITLITTILADGTNYIPWQNNIPDAIDGPTLTVTKEGIQSAIDRAEIVGMGDPVSIKFTVGKDGVALQSKGPGGQYEGDLAVSAVSGNVVFRIDSKLVRSALSGFEKDTVLQLATVENAKRLQVIPSLPNIGSNAYQLWGTRSTKKEGG